VSVAAAHAEAFRREIRRSLTVWTIVEEGHFIAPHKPDGSRVLPFWSLESRARRIVETVAAYQGTVSRKFTFAEFRDGWLTWLGREGILVGINWSAQLAVGYDVAADVVAAWFGDLAAGSTGTSECTSNAH
jgi:hypothetical protein